VREEVRQCMRAIEKGQAIAVVHYPENLPLNIALKKILKEPSRRIGSLQVILGNEMKISTTNGLPYYIYSALMDIKNMGWEGESNYVSNEFCDMVRYAERLCELGIIPDDSSLIQMNNEI
jgi:hypothetical protein